MDVPRTSGSHPTEAITPFTTMLIDSEWPMIQWLVAHLAERRELSYGEVLRLVQAA